jgi:hypothetical protein
MQRHPHLYVYARDTIAYQLMMSVLTELRLATICGHFFSESGATGGSNARGNNGFGCFGGFGGFDGETPDACTGLQGIGATNAGGSLTCTFFSSSSSSMFIAPASSFVSL